MRACRSLLQWHVGSLSLNRKKNHSYEVVILVFVPLHSYYPTLSPLPRHEKPRVLCYWLIACRNKIVVLRRLSVWVRQPYVGCTGNFKSLHFRAWVQGSSVAIVTRYRGIRARFQQQETFLFSEAPDRLRSSRSQCRSQAFWCPGRVITVAAPNIKLWTSNKSQERFKFISLNNLEIF